MFDAAEYLKHLGYDGPRTPGLDTLRELHKRHVMTVPFDNSANAAKGLAVWDEVDADVDVVFRRLITEGEGGVCHELNGIFRTLLAEFGFTYTLLAAGVRGPGGGFGPDLEHMLLSVPLDGETWLVDVGFAGLSFVEPIRLSSDEQTQYGVTYRIVDQDGYHLLQYRGATGDWNDVYRFHDTPRELAEWKAVARIGQDDHEWNWAGEVIEAGTVVRSRGTEDGKLLLVGRRLLRQSSGVERMSVLVKAEDLAAAVTEIMHPRQEA
ncbi:arylamine N-acetyltransferase [Kutzneria sp. 744]|uniref:arylamine N-acetyltransferase family protein n=1 Tax=Kutzneria sp. (strain 744) TaxID=345341 RepID=UPI0003EEBA15|nr:arylamine N-acetyltransferase [Kutzneria sp. 744]EWM18643.1 3-amino-5-hydroxybenzoic acid synthase [Kutzneria sp. 744]